MSSAADTARHAIRRLVRAPAFTMAATLTLTLGIGATVAVFTMVNGVLLRPLPYERSEQLVDLSHTLVLAGPTPIDQSDATYLLYRRDSRAFTEVGAYRSSAVNFGAPAEGRASGEASSERVAAVFATASVFRALRVQPRLGRGLTDEDDSPGAAPVVLVGQRLWERDLGSDPAIVGHRVMIDGVMRTVVGVMPETFRFPDAESGLWIPLALDPANTKSAAFDYRGIARLRDGVSVTAAAAELQRLLPHVPEAFPGRLTARSITATHMRAVVRPLRDVVVGDVGRILWIVFGAVGALLLIACANVANLFLARADGRQRELSVRRALGAGRGVLLAELLSEAALVSAAGGALGLALGVAGVRLLQSSASATIPRLADVSVDGLVVAITVGAATLAAAIVSALPILRLESVSLAAVLSSSGRSATQGRTRHRARRALVVSQVALALILLAGAGLFARSFARLRSVNPGFDSEHALTFRVSLPGVSYSTTGDVAGVVVRAIGAVAALPGVQATGIATKLPLDAESRQDSAVFVEDHPLSPGELPGIYGMNFVTPGYFAAMGIPLVAGRAFDAPDPGGQVASGPPEVIVSEAFAARYWPGAQAIGKRVRMNPRDPWHVIVGVAGGVRDADIEKPAAEMVYCPLVALNAAGMPWTPRNLAFVVRTSGDPAQLVQLVTAARRAVAALDPTIPLYRVTPASTLVSDARARTTFTLFMLGVAAIVATAIGAVGIYGVISYLVSLRTREIGVRLALGADAGNVRRLVAGQAITDALIGVVLGLIGSLVLTRSLGAVLFDVSPMDPAALGAAAIVLLLAAVAASWIPARRAAALDPAIALRSE